MFPLAGVAQLVEQLICNQPVASSSLVTSLILIEVIEVNGPGPMSPGAVAIAPKITAPHLEAMRSRPLSI
jgi:hypothetical protein